MVTLCYFSLSNNLALGSDHSDYLQSSEVLQFCDNNDQASELCYLLAQDLLEYQNISYDLQDDPHLELADDFSDYAQAVGVVSAPVFLRYLPALAKLAKNNLIVASTVALITGAIVFKKHYDSVAETLIINGGDFDQQRLLSLSVQGLSELKTIKRYKLLSQKGPEHEYKLIPFLITVDEEKDSIEASQTKEFHQFLKTAKESYESPLANKYTRFSETLSYLEDYQKDHSIKELVTKLAKFDLNDLSEFEKLIAQASSLRFFNQAKLFAPESKYLIILERGIFYDAQSAGVQWSGSADKVDKLDNVKKIWDALLLEHISHLELVQQHKDPLFEKTKYIPFVKNQISLLSIRKTAEEYKLHQQKIQNYADQVSESMGDLAKDSLNLTVKKLFNYPTKILTKSKTSLDLSLLPSEYINYQDLDREQLVAYLSHRKEMLEDLLKVVETRVDVWQRSGLYKFLPGLPKEHQAMKDWIELFKLGTYVESSEQVDSVDESSKSSYGLILDDTRYIFGLLEKFEEKGAD